MRIKNAKAKGTKFEHDVMKFMKNKYNRSAVFRSPASLGSADVLVIYKQHIIAPVNYYRPYVMLIQCKYLRKYMTKKETERIVSDAYAIAADAFLVYREKPRGKIILEFLPHDLPVLTRKSH